MDAGIGGSIEKWAGGATAHTAELIGQYIGPEAAAQKAEFKKAKNRLKTNDYGEAARVQKEAAVGQQAAAGIAAQQQADIARQQASGQLSGGAATEAQGAVAQAQQARAAQAMGGAQEAQNARAQQQYLMDQGRIDAEAQRWRDFNSREGNISMQTTGAGSGQSYGGGTPSYNPNEANTLNAVKG